MEDSKAKLTTDIVSLEAPYVVTATPFSVTKEGREHFAVGEYYPRASLTGLCLATAKCSLPRLARELGWNWTGQGPRGKDSL
jgi:hypothetical protein